MASTTQAIGKVQELILDAIFPPRCAGCRAWSDELFCPTCAGELHPLEPPMCGRCGLPFDPQLHSAAVCPDCRANRYHGAPPFEVLRSVYLFEGPVRHAVHRFKYNDKRVFAAGLSQLLYTFLQDQSAQVPPIPYQQLTLIAPVPLHGWRRYRRGYNQSELLARSLGQRLQVPVANVLRRVRHTTPQVDLSARNRADNVRGAFAIDTEVWRAVRGKAQAILLIDDVCTTGSTLGECARVLKQEGVGEVYALTLARQP